MSCHVLSIAFAGTEEDFRGRVEGDDRKAGVSILMRSLSAPMMQIAKNAGAVLSRHCTA